MTHAAHRTSQLTMWLNCWAGITQDCHRPPAEYYERRFMCIFGEIFAS
ncbi:hypothetical protein USDA257_c40790 [Sinorhizobium fredii USDA 257]|uniref:Uncharacterized protein n=1 Tax=Sinorhizobium fredii (strain USDA 257) TaxID=1185652 RepID=I3X9R5_SINF2|nr:hypothetical protein USDA257_c40790 [Sinorhizobium fredii USDA 257]